MATPLPITAPAAARPFVAPPPQTRTALMAHLLEQSAPDDMIARPPQSVGEGLARLGGSGLDTLMAKKVLGANEAKAAQQRETMASLLEGVNPELAAAYRGGAPIDPIVTQVLTNKYAPKPQDPPTPYTDLGKIAADERAGIITADQAESARGALSAPEPPDFGDVGMLRKEIQALPSYKNVTQALPIYRSMVKTAPNKTRASDLNLVYGLGKIMDPTSVVREGEMIMVKDTASIPDWLMGEINRVNGGNALQEDTRNAILAEAQTRMASYLEAWGLDAEQYKGIASRNRLKEEDVIPDIGEMPEYVPLATTGAHTGTGDGPPKITSDEEYDALPSGAEFIDPDGNLRKKP